MKRIALSSLMILALTLTLLAACGSGGGGGGGVTVSQPTTAVLTLSTSVTGTIPPNTVITGYDVTITLPDGVTVKTMLNSSATSTDVVTTDGSAYANGALIQGVYSAATGSFPGTVKVFVASATGYDPGDFCKVKCDIAAGHYPTASNFHQPTFAASGLVTSPTTSTVDLTGQLSLTETAVVN